MGYEGASLENLFEDVKEPTRVAARDMAQAAGERETAITKENTPIEGFLKDLAHPSHLRDEIDMKSIRVYTDGNDTVYETGSSTNVEYAPYVENGTGLWGPEHRKYVIRPKNPNGWLSWIASKGFTRRDGKHVPVGTRVFAKQVLHPGSPGAHMFAIGVEMAEHEFAEYTRDIQERWEREAEAVWRAK